MQHVLKTSGAGSSKRVKRGRTQIKRPKYFGGRSHKPSRVSDLQYNYNRAISTMLRAYCAAPSGAVPVLTA